MNVLNRRGTYFRRICASLALIFAISASLSGCQRLVEPENESISIYATFWPIYALSDAVMRDIPDAQLKLLAQPQDGCLRDYQLSDWDAALLSADADAILMGDPYTLSSDTATGDLGLSNARRSHEQQARERLAVLQKPRLRELDRVYHLRHGFVLPEDALLQALLDRGKPRGVLGSHGFHGNAADRGQDFCDNVLVDEERGISRK